MFKRRSHRQQYYARYGEKKRRKGLLRQLWNYLQGLAIAAILVAFCATAWWGWQRLHDASILPFRQVDFVGQLQHVPVTLLQQTVQQHLNGGFFVLNIDVLRQALQALPWVDQVAIRRIWPSTLQIGLTEQKPIAHWGETLLLNDRLIAFSVPPETIPPNLPYLYGPAKDQRSVVEFYQQLQNQLNPIGLSVAVLKVDERHSWRLQLTNGIKIILGQADVLRRCQRLIRLYPQIIRAEATDVELIDLRYANGLAIKWKSHSDHEKPKIHTLNN